MQRHHSLTQQRGAHHPSDKALSGSVFEPDILMPEQFFARVRLEISLQPEVKLLLAVLEDAVYVYQKYCSAKSPKEETLFIESKEWIDSHDRIWLFSFENVCDVIGLNASYLRRGLETWRKQCLRRTALRTPREKQPLTDTARFFRSRGPAVY